jgi:hypothetical protein
MQVVVALAVDGTISYAFSNSAAVFLLILLNSKA